MRQTSRGISTLRQVSRRPTLWCVLALLVSGASLLVRDLGAAPLSRNLPDYVILAISKFQMKDFGFTVAGNIGVNNAGGTFRFGDQSFFPDGTQVASDFVTRLGENSSLWDLYANPPPPASLIDVTIRDQGPTPWSPQPLIAVLPCQAPCTPGVTGVLVPKGGTQSLPAGAYGSVVVGDNATLTLTGGTYCLASLKVGHFAKVEVQGTSTINVPGKVKVNLRSSLVPATGLGADDLHLDVGGNSVIFSHKTVVTGIVVACNAKMRFGRFSKLRGQFIANSFRADHGPQFTLETCGDAKVDPGEDCDNTSPCCSACHYTAAGAPCPDGDRCNGDEVCNALGQCVPGTPPDCRDSNPCTDDGCNTVTGCFHDPVPRNGAPCDDSTVCNGRETCLDGTCNNPPDPDCDDGDLCTTDSCHPVNGCLHVPNSNPGCPIVCPSSSCDNGDACDGVEQCVGGFCAPGTPPDCDDNNACTSDSCNPATGCVHTSDDGEPCDDFDSCTDNDACLNSACGGFTVDCNDGNPCTADGCDPGSGCTHDVIPDCGNGTLCTLTQGAYGAGNGAANGPQGWVTLNPSILPASIGSPGTGLSVTVNNQASLVAFLPTGGTANVLCGNPMPVPCPGDLVINTAADVPDPQAGGSKGDGAGVLAGQALALTLNIALSDNGFNPPGLSSLLLPTAPFCTCAPSSAAAGPFAISACILANATTADDLLVLANQALRGVPLTSIDTCLSYSDITAALDALNTGFDECRGFCPCP